MGRKCCIPNCKSNYDTTVRVALSVSTFKIPESPALRERWLRAIKRENFVPSKNSSVCILHFHPNDIERYEKPAKLKLDAVPSIFESELNRNRDFPPVKRGRAKKIKKQADEDGDGDVKFNDSDDEKLIDIVAAQGVLSDLILNFDNFKQNLNEKVTKDGWQQYFNNNVMHFYNLNDENTNKPLQIENSIKVYDNLSIKLFLKNVQQSDEDLKWILGYESRIAKWSQFDTILNKYDFRAYRMKPKTEDEDLLMEIEKLNESEAEYGDEEQEEYHVKIENVGYDDDVEEDAEDELDDQHQDARLEISPIVKTEGDYKGDESREITFVDADAEEEPSLVNTLESNASPAKENPFKKKKKYKTDKINKMPADEKKKLKESIKRLQEMKNKCFVCNVEHETPEQLEHHLPEHLPMLPYTCERCVAGEIIVRTLVSLNNHYLMHEKPLKCSHCDVRFLTNCTRRSHEQFIHTNTGPLNCDVCGKEYQSVRGLKTHYKVHTNTEEYRCKVCQKLLSSTYELKLHMRIHTGEKPNKCPFCDASFNRVSNLTEHKRRFHSMERPFECSLCEVKVQSKLDLKKHMEIHDPQLRTDRLTQRRLVPVRKAPNKTYECKICDKQFKAANNYHSHMRQHDKKYQCSYCGVKIAQYRDFTDHENTHTGLRPYECRVCGLKFKTASTYYGHRVVHTGQKNHNCEICGRAFSRYRHVVLHMRTHSGEKPFECNVCGKKYSDTTSFKKHQRTHESDLKEEEPPAAEILEIPPLSAVTPTPSFMQQNIIILQHQ